MGNVTKFQLYSKVNKVLRWHFQPFSTQYNNDDDDDDDDNTTKWGRVNESLSERKLPSFPHCFILSRRQRRESHNKKKGCKKACNVEWNRTYLCLLSVGSGVIVVKISHSRKTTRNCRHTKKKENMRKREEAKKETKSRLSMIAACKKIWNK